MSFVNIYRMTIWTGVFYQTPGQPARSIESNFKAALPGDIHTNLEQLRERCVPVFRGLVRRFSGRTVAPEEMNIRFERPEGTSKSSPDVEVQSREYSYRGRQMYARQLPTQVLRLFEEEESDEEDEEWGDDEDNDEDEEDSENGDEEE
jgi:hypothetical protein